MQKLTKEQADWLIEQIKSKSARFQDSTKQWDFMELIPCKDLEQIINQCTERKFPSFNLPHDECQTFVLLDRDNWGDNIIIKINDLDECVEPQYFYTFDEFKQFTDGCVKVCQWLDENASD